MTSWVGNLSCQTQRCDTIRPYISIYEMSTAFMALAFGMLMGLICFLVELCNGKRKRTPLAQPLDSESASHQNIKARANVARGDTPMPSPVIFLDG